MKFFILFSIFMIHSAPQAFTLIRYSNGVVGLGWNQSTLIFDVDTSCNAYASSIQSAFSTASNVWGKVPTSSLKVELGSAVSLPGSITNYVGNTANSYAPSGNAIVYCDSSFSAHSGADANSIPGFATGYNIDSGGKITGCLLVLNVQSGASANITTLDSTVVNTVLTHEIGHCIGLGHSAETNALMYYATGVGRQTVLAKDDMDGVTYLYPKAELSGFFKGCSAIAYPSGSQLKPTKLNFVLNIFLDIFFPLSIWLLFRFFSKRQFKFR